MSDCRRRALIHPPEPAAFIAVQSVCGLSGALSSQAARCSRRIVMRHCLRHPATRTVSPGRREHGGHRGVPRVLEGRRATIRGWLSRAQHKQTEDHGSTARCSLLVDGVLRAASPPVGPTASRFLRQTATSASITVCAGASSPPNWLAAAVSPARERRPRICRKNVGLYRRECSTTCHGA